MPIVVVGTNSYAAVATIDTIADTEMYMTDWLALTADNKSRCVITGTRLIEEYLADQVLGYPTSTTQSLLFPRSGLTTRNGASISSVVIPDGVVIALAKLANLLAVENTEESQKTGLSSVAVDSIKAVFDKYDREGVIRDQVLASLSFCMEPLSRSFGKAVR